MRSAGRQPGALTPPTPAPGPSPSDSAGDASAERLHIKLPRRARTASTASAAPTPPPRSERARSRSGGDASVTETRNKSEWIDFSEVPERRKQPKRIQTLPASARDTVVFSYVPPERCRCECHAHAQTHDHEHDAEDELPLLQDAPGVSALDEDRAAPFTADLDLRHNHADTTHPQ